jgi:hypothetical protein
MKESIFLSCTAMLLLFQGFYLLINPGATWSFGVGTIIGFAGTAIIVGVASGITALTVGIGETSVRILFITSSILNLMFQFTIDLWIGPYHPVLPIGMGILYPTAWNIFSVNSGEMLGYFGFIAITLMGVLMLLCGLLMGAGSNE